MNYLNLFERKYYQSYSRNSMEDYLRCVKMFKEIQLLIVVYNGIHEGLLSITEILLLSVVFITSFYAIIKLLGILILPQLLLFLILAFCSLVVLLMEGVFKAGVYKTSKDVQRRLSQYRDNKVTKPRFRLHRKYLKSWRVVRIYIGEANFFDQQTGLVLFHFNISQVVNMLLFYTTRKYKHGNFNFFNL